MEKAVCIDDALSERRTNERAEYDLAAQRQSALWAFIAGAVAVIGMALSAAGVWLVWLTFREQRRTNELTRADADAAKVETNVIAKSFLEAQRPRIFAIRLAEISPLETDFTITLANSGQNTAIIEMCL